MQKFVILVLSMSLFFSVPFAKKAQSMASVRSGVINLKELDPMGKALDEAIRVKEEMQKKETEEIWIKQENERIEKEFEQIKKAQASVEKNEVSKKAEGKKEEAQAQNKEKDSQIIIEESDVDVFSHKTSPEDRGIKTEPKSKAVDLTSKIEKNILNDSAPVLKEIAKLNLPEKETEDEETKQKKLEYLDMLAGFPMEAMIPAISGESKEVGSFLIAIAKKESDWGKHVPQKNGQDCYNYWGYRGTYNQTDSGYSCFDTPEQAVEVVGGRIQKLLDQEIDTPEKMIVWKCGSTCAGHDPSSVDKWISDVNLYYKKLNS